MKTEDGFTCECSLATPTSQDLERDAPQLCKEVPSASLSLTHKTPVLVPPPFGWLASIANDVLDMQRGMFRELDPPTSYPTDPNRQAAKRLRLVLSTPSSSAPVAAQGAAGTPSEGGPLNHLAEPSVDVSSSIVNATGPPPLDEEPCPPCLLTQEARETSVCFLGTGSAEPSKYR
jgi:hypothetical protein